MVAMDVSDRGGRPPGGSDRSDWFLGKGHDTFAPHGPWIVPKNPTVICWCCTITVIDEVGVQEAQAGDMIHNIPELIEYASSLITVFPGDVMQSGTSGGTGAGRVQRAADQAFCRTGNHPGQHRRDRYADARSPRRNQYPGRSVRLSTATGQLLSRRPIRLLPDSRKSRLTR